MSSQSIGLTLLLGSGLSCGLVWLWGGLCLVGGLLVVKSYAGRGLCCCKIQGLAWELAQVLTESGFWLVGSLDMVLVGLAWSKVYCPKQLLLLNPPLKWLRRSGEV
ncbi:hypothetical protein U1Q18_027496 [Sarracenia purpurea var. burkii]